MELALSLGGDAVMTKPFTFVDQSQRPTDLGFCMGLRTGRPDHERRACSPDRPVQLDLLPFSPVPRARRPSSELLFPWLADKKLMGSPERSEVPAAEEAAPSSPNTSATVSSLQVDFPGRERGSKRDLEHSRALSDDEDNALTRKKLRLSKDQSAFLEESFKEHSTLNPKEKLALAKQLNLRPRQVEVWFQNRRARTKLKQTEVDCEYLKKCCETLTEENRRLQKELQELRALKSSQPFFMQLPATTLTMCPSCERVAAAGPAAAKQPRPAFPFPRAQPQLHQAQAQAQAH